MKLIDEYRQVFVFPKKSIDGKYKKFLINYTPQIQMSRGPIS